ACLMGMLEVAYALRNVADYVVASEDLEPGDGWPYDTILTDLRAAIGPTSSCSPRELAALIVTDYVDSYPSSNGITQASVDVSRLAAVASAVDAFTNVATSEWGAIQTARNASPDYHPWGNSYWGVDLRAFANRVHQQASSAQIKAAALDLRNAVDAFVDEEGHSPDSAGSHGVAIYFPPTSAAFLSDPDHNGYVQSNTFMPVDFVKFHNWDEWLQDYYSNAP
ncbi:MAG: hypothetical protein IMY84_01690, partial [Chloroflexi bacterium]|nr:hypothetical protein [Chloroflexota bacterium]